MMKDHSETTESVAFDFLSYAEECILVVNQLVSIVELRLAISSSAGK